MQQISTHLSMTGRFVLPFAQALSGYAGFSQPKIERIRSIAQRERVPVEAAYHSVDLWIQRTGDCDLGLKAGQRMRLGWGGPLEYAMHSAASVRAGIELATRYARLFSDVLLPKLEVDAGRALFRLDNKVPWSRGVADFTMSSWYTLHIQPQLAYATEVECWFRHAAPLDTTEYERVFAPAKLVFDAPCYGFAFDAAFADTKLASADPAIHASHCGHLEVLHSSLSQQRDIAARVTELVARELPGNRPTVQGIARKLHMSRRTLARRLDDEGTSFTNQLDELRRELALRYVECAELSLGQITTLLGFSQVQGFSRAFRRWTGQAPLQYRDSRKHAVPM